MTKVLVTGKLIAPALAALQSMGLTTIVKEGMAKEDLLRESMTFDAVIAMLSHRFDSSFFSAMKGGRLKVVANYAVGFDNIDLAAAQESGIRVTNTPDVLTEATAEMAWALVFAAARRVVEGDALCRTGSWRGWAPDQLIGSSISGVTIGVVGAGRIGQSFARMGRGFNPRLLYWARNRKETFESETGAVFMEIDALIEESDIISIHLPANEGTRGLFSAERLARMKRGAILINTGRGAIIDESALAAELKTGRIAAGLDVYEKEPIIHPDLLALPNVVLAPHLGSATTRSRIAMAERCGRNIVAVLKGERPPDSLW